MSIYAASYKADLEAAKAYYALCDRARAVGVPTSLDDPASPPTVAALEAAVTAAEGGAS